MKITVREAAAADARLIAQAVAMAMGEEIAKAYCGVENYLEVLTEIARMEDSQYSYRNALVALADDRPAGAIVGYDGGSLHRLRDRTLAVIRRFNPRLSVLEEETGAGEFYLDSVGVLPEFRGCGIGRRLLLAMKERAFAAGHACVGLLVDEANPDAERLYVALGFARVGTKRFFGHRMWHLQARSSECME